MPIAMKWQVKILQLTVAYWFREVIGIVLIKDVSKFAQDKGTNFNQHFFIDRTVFVTETLFSENFLHSVLLFSHRHYTFRK
jgi:hypothetical protein